MDKLLIIVLLFLARIDYSIPPYVNPTGTYKLISKSKKVDEDTYGRWGDIHVRALSKNKILMVLGVNMGATGYNSGTLIDTLAYINNNAVFKGNEWDRSCRITFSFKSNGISVRQRTDMNFGCAFGLGVYVDGFYKKVDSKVPVLRHPLTDKIIK